MTDTIASVDSLAWARAFTSPSSSSNQHLSTVHFSNRPQLLNHGRALQRRDTQPFKANCTHITVDPLYGSYSCDICHTPSPLGWLYRCRQDDVVQAHPSPCDFPMDHASMNGEESPHLQQDLHRFGFSSSIISQALAGEYTPDQLQILKEQKKHYRHILAAEAQRQATNHSRKYPQEPLLPPLWWTNLNTNTRVAPPIRPMYTKPMVQNEEGCRFKCCQRCRPYMSDRCFTSLGAVFADEVSPLRLEEMNLLPMKSPFVAATLGETFTAGTRAQTFTLNADILQAVSRGQMFDSGPRYPIPEDPTPTTATSDSSPYTDWSCSSDASIDEAGSGSDSMILPLKKVATDPTLLKSKRSDMTASNLTIRKVATDPLLLKSARSEVTTPELPVWPTIRRVNREVAIPDLAAGLTLGHDSRKVTTPDLFVRPTIRHVISDEEHERDSPDRSFTSASRSESSASLPTPSTAHTSPIKSGPCDESFDEGSDDYDDELLRAVAKVRIERRLDKTHSFEDVVQAGPIISGLDSLFDLPKKMSRSSSTETLGYLSDSSGNEMEVDGGVALPEEAVRTHTPDLVLSQPAMEKLIITDV